MKDEIEVEWCAIKRVVQIMYLEIILINNSSKASDVDRSYDTFLLQFNGVHHKFKFSDINNQCFLFLSYCISLFEFQMWYDKL